MPVSEPLSKCQQEVANEPASRPEILLVSLHKQPNFDESYRRLLSGLCMVAHLHRAERPSTALIHLSENPAAVLVTDPGIAAIPHGEVQTKLREYVNGGGTVIFAFHFPSFTHGVGMGVFFSTVLDLPWERGDFHRTTFTLNPRAVNNLPSTRRLAPSYSLKAFHLKNVSPDAAIYLPGPESTVESPIFLPLPCPIQHPDQTPVAWAQVGQGWVGYIGDVNAERETTDVILSMCGL
ncbi:hypothetical protein FQN57_003112 [Myotisia sp. PD_48]|nr:hypothetical protein FQN57_003112 [Myotisia sp. PD_48]